MKPKHLFTAILCLIAVSPALADKKKKGLAPPVVATPASVMAKYDKNSNGVLDDTEKEAIRSALGRDLDLTRFDKNGDGKLDDAELAAIAKPAPSEPEGTRKRKKK